MPNSPRVQKAVEELPLSELFGDYSRIYRTSVTKYGTCSSNCLDRCHRFYRLHHAQKHHRGTEESYRGSPHWPFFWLIVRFDSAFFDSPLHCCVFAGGWDFHLVNGSFGCGISTRRRNCSGSCHHRFFSQRDDCRSNQQHRAVSGTPFLQEILERSDLEKGLFWSTVTK